MPLVKNRLLLLTVPAQLREMVARNEISATLALDLFNEHGEDVLSALDSAEEVASTTGKAKVCKSQTPSGIQQMALKKAAPKLYEAASLVCKDPDFSTLCAETQTVINNLLSELQAKNEGAPPVHVRQFTISED